VQRLTIAFFTADPDSVLDPVLVLG